jgi:hypothetical protein
LFYLENLKWFMNPLILQFAEVVLAETPDSNFIEYDHALQLSVIKGTDVPAFDLVSERGRTFTKSGGEPTDDLMAVESSVYTRTYSATNTEVTDSDESRPELRSLLSTRTMTNSNAEGSDEDNSRHIMGTMTGTRTIKEETDSDN